MRSNKGVVPEHLRLGGPKPYIRTLIRRMVYNINFIAKLLPRKKEKLRLKCGHIKRGTGTLVAVGSKTLH